MNNLRRDIEPGEIVVLDPTEYDGPIEKRLFVCSGGFGMRNVTSGRAIFGKFMVSGKEARVEGYELDRVATEEYQASPKYELDKLAFYRNSPNFARTEALEKPSE